MIPSSRRKLSDLNTLSQSKLLENHIPITAAYTYIAQIWHPRAGKTSSCQQWVSFACSSLACSSPRGRGSPSSPEFGLLLTTGEGYSLTKAIKVCAAPKGRVLRRFGLKTDMDFAHFGLESDMLFNRTTGMYERIYCFNSTWVRKKEKYADSEWILRNLFCWCSNLSVNDDIIS